MRFPGLEVNLGFETEPLRGSSYRIHALQFQLGFTNGKSQISDAPFHQQPCDLNR